VAASNAGFGAIMDGTPGPWTTASVLARSKGLVQPIALGPALLVGLDQQRHARFVQNWMRLVNGPR
jgi:two-component system sensor histidine kinase TctE